MFNFYQSGTLEMTLLISQLEIYYVIAMKFWFWTMDFKSLYLSSKTSVLIKIGAITINIFLPTRSKFSYSCSIKIHASRFINSWKAFSASCWLWKCFPCKSYQLAWRSSSPLVRGHVNMVDEAKLQSPIHSSFEVLVV